MQYLAAIALALVHSGIDTDSELALVPADAIAVAVVSDLPTLIARGRGNPWVRALSDERFLTWAEGEIGVSIDVFDGYDAWASGHNLPTAAALLEHPHGVAVFVAQEAGSLAGLAGIVVRAAPDTAAANAFRTSVELAIPTERAVEEWRGVELEIGALDADFAGGDFPEYSTGASFRVGDLHAVFLAASREAVVAAAQAAIDRATGQSADRGFAGTDKLRDARGGLARQLELFVSIGDLLTGFSEEELRDDDWEFFFDEVRRLPWATLGASFGADGKLSAALAIGVPGTGLVRDVLRQFRPASTDLLRFAPESSVTVTGVALDVAGLYEVVLRTMKRTVPDSHGALLQTLGDFEREHGVDIVGGLVENFTGEYASFEERLDEIDEEVLASILAMDGATTLLFGLHSGERFSGALKGLLGASGMGAMIEVDDFNGTDVYSFPEQMALSPAWAVTDGLFIVSYARAPIERAIRTLGAEDVPCILDRGAFAEALAELDGACYYSISDMGQTLQFAVDALSAGAELGVESEMFRELFDEYFDGLVTTTARLEATGFRWLMEGM